MTGFGRKAWKFKKGRRRNAPVGPVFRQSNLRGWSEHGVIGSSDGY